MTTSGRRSGLLIPLFSAPSSGSWGIGDIGDIAPLSAWLAGAGQRILQLLPLNEMAPGHQSPYSAMSAMAIDPIYIRVPDVADFIALGGEASLTAEDRERLEQARAASKVEYDTLRPVKHHALCAAFDRFIEHEWTPHTQRAAAFHAWVAAESWWLEDYVVFRAIHERERGRAWTEWPEALQRRAAGALDSVRTELAGAMLFYQYLQWTAGTQWTAARSAARANGVALYGDVPFMVDLHSADVWTLQDQFQIDRSVGAPPDAFSATGQDWGMPSYDWDRVAQTGFQWLRDRARRSVALYDGCRVDHLVGFYRTYSRPRSGEGEPAFSPDNPVDQLRLGEQVLEIFRGPGSDVIAEDLGAVPDFVRTSLARLGVPGFRVFRWERDWDQDGTPFRDPANYPVISVATTGTHDTEPLVVWWNSADEAVRSAVVAMPTIHRAAGGVDLRDAPYIPIVRDALIETMFASASNVLLLPVQDVFGWADRINEPATVSDDNWTYRLPWPTDRLEAQPEAKQRQAALRGLAEKHGRV